MAFWTELQMASIHKMLNPRSIAVVGATPRMQYGGRFLAAALKAKDRVRVYAVNPRYDEIMGVKSYPTVTELPEAPDVVAVVVPWDQVLDVLEESHRKGAGSAIVISAGFAERGVDDRRDLQAELGAFARTSGMRISGPNCLGLANVKDDIWATASSRGAEGLTGPIGLVCQSGATAFGPFLVRAVENGIGFSYIISTGNEADLDFTDFARYLLDDPDTRVIAGFVEGFKEADKFLEVAKLAAERGKPIVLIKIGRSELGARAARSHTAALTGADARYDAIFAQYGVIRVQDYDELLETAHLLAHTPKPLRARHRRGIALGRRQLADRRHVRRGRSRSADAWGPGAWTASTAILKGFGWAANPADVTGFANSKSFPQIMEHMINDPRMGTLVVASAGADSQARQVIKERDRTKQGCGLPVDRKPRCEERPGTAQERPDTDLLHAGQIGPRPANAPRVPHMARAAPHRWLCHGPAAHGGAGCGHRPGPWFGASDPLEVREQRAVGGLGCRECARAPGKFRRGRRRRRRRARVSGGSQGRFAGHSAQDRGRGRSAELA